jgi:hypothetical protein
MSRRFLALPAKMVRAHLLVRPGEEFETAEGSIPENPRLRQALLTQSIWFLSYGCWLLTQAGNALAKVWFADLSTVVRAGFGQLQSMKTRPSTRCPSFRKFSIVVAACATSGHRVLQELTERPSSGKISLSQAQAEQAAH